MSRKKKRLASTAAAAPASQARRAGAGTLSLTELAQLVEDSYGSEELAKALALLDRLSPACRRGRRKLRQLARDMAYPDYSIAVAESRDAPALWRELAKLSPGEQLEAVESEEQYQTWGVCRLLQRLSGELAGTDRKHAGQLAVLAARISRQLDKAYDTDHIQDLQGLAFCYLGNAWRELGELHSAGDAFDMARSLWSSGTGYSATRAEALALEALLRRDQRQLEAAAALLDEVVDIYTSAPEDASEPDLYDAERDAEARVHRAWCLYHLGREAAAADGLEAVAGLVAGQRQARLALAVSGGLLWCSLSLGRPDVEARLAAALALADRLGAEADWLRLRRAEARVDLAAGEPGPAEQMLNTTARRLLELDLGFDAALTYFDLAALYLGAGAIESVRNLGNEILPVFSSREVQRDAMAALLLFQHACWDDRLEPGLLVELAALLEKERRPSLAWWSGVKSMLPRGEAGDGGAAAPG